MTELITIGSGRARCAGPAIAGNRGRYCTVPRSVASGGLESHRDPGGPLRRRGQRGDESFGGLAIAASSHDPGGIGGGICYGCWQRPHDFDAFRRHDLADEGRANLCIADGYPFHYLVAVAAKECFVADRGGDAEPFEQAGQKNPRRAARLRVRVSDRTGLEHCLLEAFRRRDVRHRRGGVHADAGQGAAEFGPATRDEHACSLHLRNHRRRPHDDIRGLPVLEPLLHAADRRETEFDIVARIARELRGDVGDDVFHRSGGQDFQIRGGTGNGRGWWHHPTLAHSSRCPCWTVKIAYGHMRVLLSKIQANWHRGKPARTSLPQRDAAGDGTENQRCPAAAFTSVRLRISHPFRTRAISVISSFRVSSAGLTPPRLDLRRRWNSSARSCSSTCGRSPRPPAPGRGHYQGDGVDEGAPARAS